jgi:tetratricopeptide (TPR) repeat protein
VHILQEALFDSTPDFAVPLSLLLRPGNDLVAIYRGALSRDTLIHDCRTAAAAPDPALRDLAPPFPGRWFTLPAEPAFLPRLIARRIQARYPEDALFYLHLAAEKSEDSEKQNLMAELGHRHFRLAVRYEAERLTQKADYHFAKSLEVAPNNAAVHNDFGTSLANRGRLKEGEKHFAEALRLQPDFPLAEKNLARARELLRPSGK